MCLKKLLKRRRKQPKDLRLPKHCDICWAEIGLYEPFYTVFKESHFVWNHTAERLILCPSCMKAYESYINNRKEHFIHQNTRKEVESWT